MSTQTIVNNTGNQIQINTDISKIFVWNNRYDSGLFDEPNGAGEFTLSAGQLIGRIGATGKLKICSAAETDGSQFPIGVVLESVVMAQSATDVVINYCISGDVVEDKLLFSGVETLASTVTVIAAGPLATDYLRTLRDLIQAMGIKLVGSDELTGTDNS